MLTAVACLLAVVMVVLAFCMAFPVRWDGPGKFGALALYFPLHLLVFTLLGVRSRFTSVINFYGPTDMALHQGQLRGSAQP